MSAGTPRTAATGLAVETAVANRRSASASLRACAQPRTPEHRATDSRRRSELSQLPNARGAPTQPAHQPRRWAVQMDVLFAVQSHHKPPSKPEASSHSYPYPEARVPAKRLHLNRYLAILICSGKDWSQRMRRLAARAPELNIFSSGY